MTAQVTLTGNATRDPELRYTPSGAALVTFGLAVNRRWFNKSKEDWEEDTSFFDVVAWQELAENTAETVSKGMRLTVVGRLEQRTWETEGGEKRSKVEVVADDIGPSLRRARAAVQRSGENRPAESPAVATPDPEEDPF